MFNFWSKPDPKEEQREVDRQLRKVGRDIERDRRQLEREEQKLELEIKKLAKEGNREGCKLLAKQLVQMRKQKQRTYVANSKVQGIAFQNKAMGANVKLAEAMGTAGRTMSDMNKIMKPEDIAATVNAFSRENMKMEMTDEMINDTLDDMLTESGDEEESDHIITKVLDEIGIEMSGAIAGAPMPESSRVGEHSKTKGMSDDDIEAQLAKLRS
ncbi:charged multivesicular body protein 2b isoform X2 [Leptinotarsa decemlineata]|uniref:charged multivesicular body protein 2b isoform X2 n=1 Tax=Leptinotarsa decemlineata TaxID=7539 RepID=UPI000C25491E|nr:charged multivesicular body protein 2b-B [Leptinotarsa decemlineata]